MIKISCEKSLINLKEEVYLQKGSFLISVGEVEIFASLSLLTPYSLSWMADRKVLAAPSQGREKGYPLVLGVSI